MDPACTVPRIIITTDRVGRVTSYPLLYDWTINPCKQHTKNTSYCCSKERDPVLKLSDDYVMVGRVAAILRGLGYAVKHKPSTAKLWAPQARELLRKHDSGGGGDAAAAAAATAATTITVR